MGLSFSFGLDKKSTTTGEALPEHTRITTEEEERITSDGETRETIKV